MDVVGNPVMETKVDNNSDCVIKNLAFCCFFLNLRMLFSEISYLVIKSLRTSCVTYGIWHSVFLHKTCMLCLENRL